MFIKYISNGMLYAAGLLGWLIIFFSLKTYCIIDIYLLVDGLWTTRINDELVENLTNSIAYRTQNIDCDNVYIFTARYYPDGVDGNPEIKSLTSMIDIKSWKETDSDTISTTYTDSKHEYVVFKTSDGNYMSVYDNE